MKRAGKAIFNIGWIIFIPSACCLDSLSYIFGAVAVIGLIMVAIGYRIGGKYGR
jgi:hypothetical protein